MLHFYPPLSPPHLSKTGLSATGQFVCVPVCMYISVCVCVCVCLCLFESKREIETDRQKGKDWIVCACFELHYEHLCSHMPTDMYCILCVWMCVLCVSQQEKKSPQGSMSPSQLHNPYSLPLLCQSQLTYFCILYLPVQTHTHPPYFCTFPARKKTCLMDSSRLHKYVFWHGFFLVLFPPCINSVSLWKVHTDVTLALRVDSF